MKESAVKTALMPREQLEEAAGACRRITEELDRILLGRPELHRLVLVGILSRGHILLEGVPGVGKTALVKALSQLLHLDFNRVQFTPDLMPGDILGMHILQENEAGMRDMVFHEGPVFTNLLLADEINRATPKTQSALLEAMQERCVTLMGSTRRLPEPFFVLASQNPIELEGTYPLPEAQLDRFMLRLMVGGVDAQVMEGIISTRRHGQPPEPEWHVSPEQLGTLFEAVDAVFLPRPVARYISRLVAATHPGCEEAPDAVRSYVEYGASPRAAIALAETARAHALLAGRPTAGFEDVKTVLGPVVNHRLVLNYKARFDKVNAVSVAESVLEAVEETGIELPEDVEVPA